MDRPGSKQRSDSLIIRQLIGRRAPERFRTPYGTAGLPGVWRLDKIAGSLNGRSLALFEWEWPGDLFQADWNPKRSLKLYMSATPSGRAQFGVKSLVYTSYGSPVPGSNYGGHNLPQAIDICEKQFLTLETMGETSTDSNPDLVRRSVREVLSGLNSQL